MGCVQYREALSALLDQEEPNLPVEAVRAHLASCSSCAAWEEEAGRVGRLVRVAPAEAMPDLAPLVLPAAPSGRRARTVTAVRAALVVVAVVQALLAWSGALTGHDGMATGHLAEETGAWNLALAVAFLAAATRPRTAGALVAPIGVFVAVLFVTAAGDVVADAIDAGRLAAHLLVAAGLGLIVLGQRLDAAGPGGPPARLPWSGPRATGPTGSGPAILVPVSTAPAGPTVTAAPASPSVPAAPAPDRRSVA